MAGPVPKRGRARALQITPLQVQVPLLRMTKISSTFQFSFAADSFIVTEPKIGNSDTLMRKILLTAVLALTAATICRADDIYHFIKEIPVGGDGGWDYLSVDPLARRLYVSHATKVVVIDIDKDAVVGEIPNTPGVHGLAPAPDLGKGFVSCGRENKCAIVDLKTLQTLSKVDTGQNPDGMLYEPVQQEAYLFNGRSGSATVIGAKDGKVVATVALDGKPEFAQADSQAGRVYDNLEDKSEVVAIDTKTHTVVNRWPIAPGEAASGMAIDVAHHRLFLGCDNKMMVMMDNQSGKVVGSVPIGEGVDANAFDPETQLAFASCGDGTCTIAHEDAPDKLTVVQVLKTQPRARTMTIDPKTHRIYLATGEKNTPNSFKILVYGSEKK
jgi:DNA-binding beta-propeller fold protein YncE